MEQGRFTIVIYTENQIGLLVQVSNIFTRRSLGIWSMYAAPTPVEGIHTITIVADGPENKVIQAVQQLEKRVEVIKVYYDHGNTLEGWAQSPSVTEQRNQEVRSFLSSREEQHANNEQKQ